MLISIFIYYIANIVMVTDFSAQAPALGYFYQIRYSLLLLLRERDNESSFITIEGLDDITVESEDEVNLVQTKLHIEPDNQNLTNASADFWKTIRVWSDNILKGYVEPTDIVCTLITTQKIPDSSLLYFLKDNTSKDIKIICKELKTVAKTSKNKGNQTAYQTFLKLTDAQMESLINNIHIIDGSVGIDLIENEIKRELAWSVVKNKINPLLERLEGWWFSQSILHLLTKKDHISHMELSNKIFEITDKLRADNLPVDFPNPLKIQEEDVKTPEKYIRQLNLIKLRKNSLMRAVSDYRRAYSQKSKWIKDNLIQPQEYINYNMLLVDYWDRRFALLKDEIEEKGLKADDIVEKAKEFYKKNYIDNQPPCNIRERFQEAYLGVGSSHMLSNDLTIGWHPNYEELINGGD